MNEEGTGGFHAITEYYNKIMALSAEFTNINSFISGGFSSSLDKETGLIAGLQCGPLISQLRLTFDIYCQDLYTNFINFNILLSLICYSIVFAMLFSVCAANKFNRSINSNKVA